MNAPYYVLPNPLTVVRNGETLCLNIPAKVYKDIELKRGDKVYLIIARDSMADYMTFDQAMQEINKGNRVYNLFNRQVIYYANKDGKFVKSRRDSEGAFDFAVTPQEIASLWRIKEVGLE